MKKLKKKSLDELAMTMEVIPDNELDNYWGMYSNDCFWRCVAYLSGAGNSESAAASYAVAYYASQYTGSDTENVASAISYLAQNGAGMTTSQMANYNYDGINRRFIQVYPPDALASYGFSGGMNHAVVFIGPNQNGAVDLYCPQTDTTFTMSFSDYQKRIY